MKSVGEDKADSTPESESELMYESSGSLVTEGFSDSFSLNWACSVCVLHISMSHDSALASVSTPVSPFVGGGLAVGLSLSEWLSLSVK